MTIDNETSEMIKKRFGEQFHGSLVDRLEVKQIEVRRAGHRDNKKRNFKGGKKGDKPDRPQR